MPQVRSLIDLLKEGGLGVATYAARIYATVKDQIEYLRTRFGDAAEIAILSLAALGRKSHTTAGGYRILPWEEQPDADVFPLDSSLPDGRYMYYVTIKFPPEIAGTEQYRKTVIPADHALSPQELEEEVQSDADEMVIEYGWGELPYILDYVVTGVARGAI